MSRFLHGFFPLPFHNGISLQEALPLPIEVVRGKPPPCLLGPLRSFAGRTLSYFFSGFFFHCQVTSRPARFGQLGSSDLRPLIFGFFRPRRPREFFLGLCFIFFLRLRNASLPALSCTLWSIQYVSRTGLFQPPPSRTPPPYSSPLSPLFLKIPLHPQPWIRSGIESVFPLFFMVQVFSLPFFDTVSSS